MWSRSLAGVIAVCAIQAVGAVAKPSCSSSPCARDDCYRQVFGTITPGRSAQGAQDCTSYLQKTVSPCPITEISTSTVSITVSTTTISQTDTVTVTTTSTNAPVSTTVTQVNTDFTSLTPTVTTTEFTTETDTVTVSSTMTVTSTPPNQKRDVAGSQCPATISASSNAIPTYASSCTSTRFSSVCSCNGNVPSKTSTITSTSTTTTTTTTTSSIVATTTTDTTTTTTVTIGVSSTDTITAFVTVTSTITAAASTSTITSTITTTTTTTDVVATTTVLAMPTCTSIEAPDINGDPTYYSLVYTGGDTINPNNAGNQAGVVPQPVIDTYSGSDDVCTAATACIQAAAVAQSNEGGIYFTANLYLNTLDNLWMCVLYYGAAAVSDFNVETPGVSQSYGYLT